jgi:16S rRNA (guanine1207-N2)-methyltransferase
MVFQTASTLFSPEAMDAGTRAMLSCAELKPDDKVLDLGCGYGVVGIYAAKLIGGRNVTMTDIDGTAVDLALNNAAMNGVPDVRVLQSDGFDNIDDTGYTLILSNPPYHADFSVAKRFIEKGFNRLAVGGRMMMVTKRRDWYKNKFIAIFGGVKITEADGYFIFTAEKRAARYAKN